VDPLVATLVVILLALLGARFSFSTERVPAGPRLLFRTGTHFLFLGLLLGPLALGLLSDEALAQLHPLIGLGLGWIGLHFGLQLDRETLRQFPPRFHLMALGQAALTFAIFAGVSAAVLVPLGFTGPVVRTAVIAAAATAALSTPAGVAVISANFLVRGQVRRLLFFIASLDGLVGIVALHLLYAGLHGSPLMPDFATSGMLFWTGAGLGLGLVCGILFLWLIRLRPGREELVLYLLGISALCAGAALQLQLSPLFAGTVMGAVVANLAADRARVYRALQKWEKPIYVVLLILTGAALRIPTWWVVPLALAYTGLRAVGKGVGTALLVLLLPGGFPTPRRLGLGLLPQGGISIAMALSLILTLGGAGLTIRGIDAVDVLVTTVVAGVVLSELLGPYFTTRVLRRAGEITRQVEEALEEGDEVRARSAAIKHHAPAGPTPEADGTDATAPSGGGETAREG
jgi:Kef-type K+ transport system membrane component KefB